MRPIFWISGNYYDSRKKWESIKSLMGPSAHVLDIDSQCSQNAMGDVIVSLKTKDLFNDNPRLFRIYGCPSDYTILHDYLRFIDDSNVVVIYGHIGYNVPAGVSSRFISAKNSKLYKSLNEWGNVFEFPTDARTDAEAIAWISQASRESGKTISKQAAEMLVLHKGRNLDSLYCEIVRLLDYCDKDIIQEEDIENTCIPEYTKTIWDILDSLGKQNYLESMSFLQQFYAYAEASSSRFQEDMNGLFAAIERQFSFALMISPFARSFNDAYNAVKGLKKREKKEGQWQYTRELFDYSYMKMNFSKDSTRHIVQLGQQRITDILLDIYRCSYLCRINSNMEIQKHIINSMAMHICGIISLNAAQKIREKVS